MLNVLNAGTDAALGEMVHRMMADLDMSEEAAAQRRRYLQRDQSG
jgi:hypothetical protein